MTGAIDTGPLDWGPLETGAIETGSVGAGMRRGARGGVFAGLAVVAALLAGCAEREVILPGERIDIFQAVGEAEVGAEATPANRAEPIRLPAARANASWPQAPVTPATRTAHPALGGSLSLAWSAPIGEGDKRKQRITAAPVVEGGRVFTLDSSAQVTATTTGGATAWTYNLTPLRDNVGEASGGGLAVGGGRLYVTSGFGRVVALDPATGREIWVQDLGNTGTGTPAYRDGLVYLVAGDQTAWAIEADNGRIRWQLDSVQDVNNVAGGPAPAVTDKAAIFAFGSGEVTAAFRKGGLTLWNAAVAGSRPGRARSDIEDITGGPVVDGNVVYVGNFTGSLVALNADSGDRIWTVREGTSAPVWPAGGSVFAITDLGELVRLDASDGSRIWGVALPGFVKDRPRKRAEVVAHHGPVVAGGRVLVASNDGVLRQFDPVSGRALGQVAIPGGATADPVVAGRTLYVVSGSGNLLAYR